MIYLDATALMKLIDDTPESAPLITYLGAHTDTRWFTCTLVRADLLRAAARLSSAAVDHANQVLDGLDTVAITDRLITVATELDPAPTRTTDALHIAAALTAGPRLRALVTYDPELAENATAHHIHTTAPGGSQ